ncbi:LacI family DNA-binding transcriptional regulator [Bifidobacterium sp. 82T24]|uniref:LacI family transcriptional regulator n=2 Tax=Bifidobacterium TaxID=1678 RepID=A0A2M9H6N2_9BIFI|nr:MULTISPECIES: LacI family DNA-binding transcriptional regulator [Bifidobacterium]MBW3088347.1 LacI family DNA-binding transcriptional regulator [Bifidobacterium pluvialisilvae]NEG97024.1 LacI family DNA-binding transcriptional regulator [Bifidobacterium sp. SMB2]NEH11993.1 LacI family DNA-binding transcriptional regulator [Bifidobacterium saimiriisciurei]PJM72461.1 LacI family transcriptional regulator [Bifidobacterium primatium]
MTAVEPPHSGTRKTTLAEVAAAAGVSLATASKALNNQPRVSDATRRRVQEAAEKLSYIPNAQAQSLISGRTNSIGVITSDLTGRFCTPILLGAEDEFGVTSNTVLLCNARGDALLERNHLSFLLSRNVDGLLIVGDETDPRPHLDVPDNVPVVYVYAPSDNADDCSVVCDNVEAGEMAVNHLLSCGKRKIAIIGGSDTTPNAHNLLLGSPSSAQARLNGSLKALHEAGLEPAGPVRFSQWTESWGRAATRLLLDQNVDFDAVVCQCDGIARGCMDVLKERGISIPSQVAVIGHDNRDMLAPDADPPLTSIDNCPEELGHVAARALIDAINGRPHHGVESISCRLVQRESTLPM